MLKQKYINLWFNNYQNLFYIIHHFETVRYDAHTNV